MNQAPQAVQPAQWHQIIESSKDKFNSSSLDFKQEQIFATQQLMNNSYLLDVAKKNLSSLRLAMYNVCLLYTSPSPRDS